MPALIVDPELIAAVTRQFRLKGELQPFNLTENVVPIFDIGRLIGITQVQKVTTPDSLVGVRVGTLAAEHLQVLGPDLDDTDIDFDAQANPTAGTILADTGQLAAGLHLINARYDLDGGVATNMLLEWRNAANAATLATWQGFPEAQWVLSPILISVLADERIRFQQNANVTATVATTISAAAAGAASIA